MFIEIPDELYEDIKKLIKDKEAKNKNKVEFDINSLISKDMSNVSFENGSIFWGEEVTVKRNWKSSPQHPETFLAYITVAEAKLLRYIGLGYSLLDNKYKQHFSNHNIPSFNGDGYGLGSDGDSSIGEKEGQENNSGGGGGNIGPLGPNQEFNPTQESLLEALEKYNEEENNWWTNEKFINPLTNQKGIISYDQQGNFSVNYDDNTGFGFDQETQTNYGYDKSSSYAVGYDAEGNINSAYGSINDPVNGGHTKGVSTTWESTWYGDKVVSLSYKDTVANGMKFGIKEEILTTRTFGSLGTLDTSFLGNVTAYNKNFVGGSHHFGTLASMAYKGYGIQTAFNVDIATTVLSLGTSLLSIPTSMAILGNISKFSMVGKIAGLAIVASDFNSLYEGITSTQNLAYASGYLSEEQVSNKGLSAYASNSIFSGNFSDGDNSGEALINQIALNGTSSSFNTDINTQIELNQNLNMYEHMAGGIIYNEVFAGGDIFDGQAIPTLAFAVGKNYSLSANAKRIHNPYDDLAGGKFYEATDL